MKRILVTLAAIFIAAPAMAQTIPPIPNVTSLTTGKSQLQGAGHSLEIAADNTGAPLGLRNSAIIVIEAGTGPNGVLNNASTGQFNLGTIHGSIPQPH